MINKLKKLMEDMGAMTMTTVAMGTPPVKAVGEPVGATPKKKKKKVSEDEEELLESLEELFGHPIGRNRRQPRCLTRKELNKYRVPEDEFKDSLIEQEAKMYALSGSDKEDFRPLCVRRGFTPKEIAKLLVKMKELGIDCKGLT